MHVKYRAAEVARWIRVLAIEPTDQNSALGLRAEKTGSCWLSDPPPTSMCTCMCTHICNKHVHLHVHTGKVMKATALHLCVLANNVV